MSAAREAAWQVLSAWLVADETRARLGSKQRPFPPPTLSPRDRAFAKDLAEGSIARKRSLDAVLDKVTDGRTVRPVGLRAALLLSTWQLLFAPELATHSVVNDGVELAKRAAGRGGASFANAILRRVSAMPTLEDWILPPVLGDVEATATWHSLPTLVVERWLAAFGSEVAPRLFESVNANPPRSLRTREAVAATDDLVHDLEAHGFGVTRGPASRNLLLESGRGSLLDLDAFKNGRFSLQDATQIEVVNLVMQSLARSGETAQAIRVLDYCAAPGTKTCAIAECLGEGSTVFAYDQNAERLAMIHGELKRLGLTNVIVLEDRAALDSAAQRGDGTQATFDAVLVDAPCSNSGVFARRKEARWRFTKDALLAHRAQQEAILAEAARYVKPGGILVYATCSIEEEENESVVGAFAESSRFRVVSAERTLPEAGVRDGGGVALMIAPKLEST